MPARADLFCREKIRANWRTSARRKVILRWEGTQEIRRRETCSGIRYQERCRRSSSTRASPSSLLSIGKRYCLPAIERACNRPDEQIETVVTLPPEAAESHEIFVKRVHCAAGPGIEARRWKHAVLNAWRWIELIYAQCAPHRRPSFVEQELIDSRLIPCWRVCEPVRHISPENIASRVPCTGEYLPYRDAIVNGHWFA